MTQDNMARVMEGIFRRCEQLREAGQKEYAHKEDNAFRNFESIAEYLNIPREVVLLTYAVKHLDGITAYVNGHESQRDTIFGRICDLIVYLCLLAGMIVEDRIEQKRATLDGAPASDERAVEEIIEEEILE